MTMDKLHQETETWGAKRLKEVLLVDRFKEMGKENDPIFQTLVFLGNGTHQLSLGTTILRDYTEFPAELKAELKAIQKQLHDFTAKLRELEYCCGCEGVIEPITVHNVPEICFKCYKSRM